MSERRPRCDYCGRYMTWARWDANNCFAGDVQAYCPRAACTDRGHADTAEHNRRRRR